MIFNRSNRNSTRMMFDLAWHYHDPGSGELVVYNNGRFSVKQLSMAVSTDQGLYLTNIENSLSPRTGNLIALALLKGNANEQFSGTIFFFEKWVFRGIFRACLFAKRKTKAGV